MGAKAPSFTKGDNNTSGISDIFCNVHYLAYQMPIYETAGEKLKLAGYEMLARNRRALKLSPEAFTQDLAARNQLSLLDTLIFKKACAEAKKNPRLTYSTNISSQTLATPDLILIMNTNKLTNEAFAKHIKLEILEHLSLIHISEPTRRS